MIGTVSWSCVSCKSSEESTQELSFVLHGPGAAVEGTFSYIAAAKRRVAIYTLCKYCHHGLSQELQLSRILLLAGQTTKETLEVWKNQEWKICCTWAEYVRVMTGNGKLKLHVSCSARLSRDTGLVRLD